MRLKSLYIEKYKNLSPLTIDFESGNGLTMLVGNNGSGKSNVLESISGIFHDLFQGKGGRKITCNYKLEYALNELDCILEQKNGVLRCYAPKFKSKEEFVEQNAPNNVIGLYSGEEDRLWTSFYESYYKAYIRRIKTNQHQERMHLMLINKHYWNVALLTLLMSDNETLRPFIENDIGITSVSKIELSFCFKYFGEVNELLKAFIDKINPEHKAKQTYTLEELKSRLTHETHLDELGNSIADEREIEDLEVFQFLTQAYMPKNEKIIKGIIIEINDGITVQQLSEGEKKLILVKTVLEILADEKTLVLMDEPDAHLHEGRKPALCSMMREYPNRQIIIATHSPIMAQLANENELMMLEHEGGRATLLSEEKIDKIKHLSGTSWDIIGQAMMLKSNRPLVVFEGKTDVMYVKRALDMLKSSTPKYASLNVDFLNANGAGNIKSFVENLKAFVPITKKIIIFFDRDNAGKDGVQGVTGVSKNDERIVNYTDIIQNNIITSFIPYKEGVNDGDFLIEDYFSWDGTIKAIVEDIIPDRKHPIKLMPNLPDRIKKELEKRVERFAAEEFKGFVVLLDKIVELSKEAIK